MAACFFSEWGEGCMDAEGTSCTGWYLAEPPKEKVIGRLRIYVDRAVGINKSSLKPIVKLMDKHSGETAIQSADCSEAAAVVTAALAAVRQAAV